jgi:ATP-dependent DNA helicase RecQ
MDGMDLTPALKRYFGFDAFRPLQEEIIRDSLAGRDVFALLPTGGGKSLCFQLPALLRDGLTVVVSPLIALMKDQVDALQEAGIAATYLNSSLEAGESRARLRGLHGGEFKLLYVAPERLLLSGFLEDLKRWGVSGFAIDEAHCISEWGHDFRPEYRQMATLREMFPEVPFMALTATATERVRDDILAQLHFHDPRVAVASFRRSNLTFRVNGKAGAYKQIRDFIKDRPKESGIVYCMARRTAESIAEKLAGDGIAARPYHAGLPSETRAANQEAFLRDETRVICATIAFGMGIDKSNVRFVIHHDLPKNIEGYYQEIGRAGRDGLPSECLMLFSAGDRVKYSQFIDELTDETERERAREHLERMVHYAEDSGCRHAALLRYFGEEVKEENCGACDNCLSPRERFDGTTSAKKFLSCVFRVRQKSGFSVGVGHVVEVLCGAETAKIKKWEHDTLSTYGIGNEHSRNEWAAIGRELVRLGLLRQDAERFNVVELTREGIEFLKSSESLELTRPMTAPATRDKHRSGEIECDEALFERLRGLRKQLADERGVPPYIVFSDVALRQMARHYPQNEADFGKINGVGEKKLAEFGETFMEAVAEHLESYPRHNFHG